jgi:hypothetical protein
VAICRALMDAETPLLPIVHHVLAAPEVQQEPALFMVTVDEQQ